MNIIELALLGSLRIAFFGALKAALFAYTLFLSDTAFASVAPEGNEHKAIRVGAIGGHAGAKPSNRRSMP